jgi:hypothetical protein
MTYAGHDLIRIFDADPDLLEGVEPRVAERLRRRLAVRRLLVSNGPWGDTPDYGDDGHLGLLVLDGVLIRTLELSGRECSEVVGPGDIVRPWDPNDVGSVDQASGWRALGPASMAVLDPRFAKIIAPWPAITAQLMARGTRRCRALMYQAAIARVRHAETRLLLALWNLADRWGRVTPDGIVVPVPLTHRLLAHLTCLQRPTVTSALRTLVDEGRVQRLPDGGWMLFGEPPADELEGVHHERELAAV